MAVSFDIDPKRPETHINHPAPPVDKHYTDELAELGGGRLRFAWGQERRQLYAGEMRILYTDDRIEPVITHEPDYIAVKCRETEDVTILKAYPELLNYDEKKYERIFRRGRSSAEFIGQPLYFVEERVALRETEASWNQNRYGEWEDPATGRLYHNFDLLGPYPSERWEAFFVVGEPTGESDPFGGRIFKYRPIGEDVMASIKRRLYERDHAEHVSESLHFKRRWDEQEAKEANQRATLADRIRQELLPHKHRFLEFGSRVSVPSNFKPRRKAV